MAIEGLSRWQMIREIILESRSGTLIAQLGKNFLHWMIAEGKLICISSTLPEYSFTQFLLQKGTPGRPELLRAQSLIHDQRSLGSALLDARFISAEELKRLLEQHWSSLTYQLLQSSTHLFWSDRKCACKHHFIRADLSLQEIILAGDRSFVDTRAAIRFAQSLPPYYRVVNWPIIEKFLLPQEKRMVNYLKSCAPVSAMMKDPELDKMTCYRLLFLLWLAGAMLEPSARKHFKSANAPQSSLLLQRMRSLPPDWIFPLFAGVVIGVILAPGPGKSARPASPPQSMESLRDVMTKPAWQTDEQSKHEDKTLKDSQRK